MKQLKDRKHDDDYATDEDIVKDHRSYLLKEVKETIKEFLVGDPLVLCRNVRDEFSGIPKAEEGEY